jgi:hypothetical protein
MEVRLCYICETAAQTHGIYCTDCRQLVDAAIAALQQARQDGCLVQGYDPSSWREDKNRLDHAATHIYVHKRKEPATTEDHLAHAICDLVIEYARR